MSENVTIRWKLTLGVAAVAMALAGCASPQPIAAPPAVVQSPTPTPTVAPEPVVASLVITPRAMELRTSGGDLVDSFDFFVAEDSARAIPALTELFGADPEEEFFPAETHFPDLYRYTWDGFVFNDNDHKSGPSFPEYNDAFVLARAAEINGVRVETTAGSTVGSQVSIIDGAKQTLEGDAEKDLYGLWSLERVDVSDELSFDLGTPAFVSLIAESDEASDEVTALRAPAMNFGA